MKKQIIGLLLCIFSFFLFSNAMSAETKTEIVRIAILPCSDVVKTFERFKPLKAYIEQETGFKVQTVFPKNEQDLISLFIKKDVDFIFHSPFGFAEVDAFIDMQSLLKALGPDGKDFEIGYLVVRKDSGLRTFQDLKEKTVFLGMECSASRWISARNLFIENGMDIEKDLGSYTDGGCCEDICFNVFLKAADAGLVCQHYFDEQKKLGAKHVEALAVIGQTRPTPTRIFAAHKETPRTIIDQIQRALRAIDRNDPKYESLVTISEIGGFVGASPNEYRELNGY